jgi:small subunit ribosomal protein S1
VERPAEVVRPGDELQVKILEVDEARRRLSLSVKRVEGQELPVRELTEDVVIEDAEPPEDIEAPAAEVAPEAPPEEETVPDEAPSEEPAEEPSEEPPSEEPASEEPASEEPSSEEPPPAQG